MSALDDSWVDAIFLKREVGLCLGNCQVLKPAAFMQKHAHIFPLQGCMCGWGGITLITLIEYIR